MIEILAGIGFIGILAHVVKSWIDWTSVRAAYALIQVFLEFVDDMQKNFKPCVGFIDRGE